MRLIDADALKPDYYDEYTFGDDEYVVRYYSEHQIDSAPSIDIGRPQGEWVPFEYGDERWHKCTACGVADRYIEYVERPNGTTGKLVAVRNFCPNCGAKMKIEK